MMSRIQAFFKLYHRALAAGLISGVLVGTSFIPFPPWALFFCYAPLWFFALKKSRTWKEVLLAGWTAQFVLTLIGFHWISYVAHEFGFFPWPLALGALGLFAAGMHVYIALTPVVALALAKKCRLSRGATALSLACLQALFEQFWPSIFSWNLGYPLLAAHSPLAQWADVVGFAGLSFAVYLINAWVVWLFLRRDPKLAIGTGLILAGALALLFVGGIHRQQLWKVTDSELKVLLVQANIGNAEKLFAERGAGFQQEIANQFFELTREALRRSPETDLVVWPESAFPEVLDDFAQNRGYNAQFRQFVRSINKPVLTGAFSKDPPGKPFRDDYNAVFLFNEKAELQGEPYHKTQLLIFGEYIPYGHEFPILAKWNPGGAGWGRGTGPTVLKWGETGFGIQICYESLDPFFSRDLARRGAQILVNVTNDSWFGPRSEPYQNLEMSLARALETRRPLIRSTNTGISAGILADGTVLESSPLFEKWAGVVSVKFQKNPSLSFYSRFGSWLSPLIFVFLVGTLWLGRNGESLHKLGLERNP